MGKNRGLSDTEILSQRIEDLAREKQKFQDLVEGSVQGIMIHRNFQFLFGNQALADIFGYESNEEMRALGDMRRILAPEEITRLQALHEARLRGESPPSHYEFQGIRKDGTRIWLEHNSRRVDWEGAPAVQTTMFNISERKQAEEGLKASQRLLKTVLDVLPQWVFVKDRESRYLMTNIAFAESRNAKPEELIGAHTSEVNEESPAASELFLETDRRVLNNGERVEIPEYTVTLPDGSTETRQAVKLPLREEDGTIVGVVGVSTDITEHKRAEKELRDSEQRFRRLIDTSLQGVYIHDQHRFLYVNHAFAKLFGYESPQEVLEVGDCLQFYAPDDRERLDGYYKARISGGSPPIRYGFQGLHKDGSTIWLENLVQVVEWRGRQAILATVVDISDRKQFEQELARERRNLEQIVLERTKELEVSLVSLEDSNLQLQKANLARAQFLSSMSHELRTPLNAIIGFSDLLRGQHFGKLNQKQMNQVVQIEGSGKHLLSLINDLLDMAKIDAGGMEVELDRIDVNEFLESTAAMMGSQFSIKNISVRVRCDPDLPTLYADSRKVRQIMLNLLSNAIKFTHEKGNIEIRAEGQDGASVRISVQDDGIGIEEEELEHIFFKYYQAKNAKDVQPRGIGIGLPLTKRLVELHGGQIDVSSTPGSGSTFRFDLPVRNPPGSSSALQEQAEEEDHPGSRPRRILVAEDNEINLALILDMLSIHGHETAVARNGLEAIELAKSHAPELILMDVRMPVMDGLEAVRKLREIPEFAKIPIIALTASTGSDAEERQLVAGFTEHLAKPIQASELFATLEHHLN